MGLFKSNGDDNGSKHRFFGGKKEKSSPNPYAQSPRIDPFTKAKIEAGVAPMPENYAGSNGSPASQSPHMPSDKYHANKYSNQGGYGSKRFDDGPNKNSPASGSGSRYGAGGYGGLGSSDPNDPATDAARSELFGNSKKPSGSSDSSPPPYSEGSNEPVGQAYGGGSNDHSMATFQERHLTAEEEEEQEVAAIKGEIRFIKQGDVSSTRNALRIAAQAEETGRETLARLGAQGEKLGDTEMNLDKATIEGRIADEKARELKTLNKSMFAVHVSNPFTASQRERKRLMDISKQHQADREIGDRTRAAAYGGTQRMERTFRDLERDAAKQDKGKGKKASVTDRAKYQFEADSEDERLEDEIEQNLDLLKGASSRLNLLAKATGNELDAHNRHLDRITGKSDSVDDQLATNRARLDRIR